ncbi:MtN3 and saliva related transmembrane protein (fragment) [Bradyrhizobium sp. ORS 375]|uniref:SemiSWEET family sugar transporter n=1 Tax=Bradyrhizobium sp. (strain ORS 375) TaxID=566679 RepID=UPI000240911E
MGSAFAAALTSLSYVPQVRKAYPSGATHDLSVKTLLALGAGLALWVAYGVIRDDIVVVIANLLGASLVIALLGFKIRDIRRG